MDENTRVVLVGAGMSGLIAARDLRRRGVDVVVLEAADRPGGRSLAETTALGSRVDLGGQWIGHDHDRLVALADELGSTRYVMHTWPVPAIVADGRRVRPWSLSIVLALVSLVVLSLIRALRPSLGSTSSVQDWLNKVPGRARRLLEVAALVSWTADLDRVSARTALTMIKRQHGLITMLSTKGGAQDSLIVEGVGTLVERLAADLGPALRLGRSVTEIARDDEGVTVRTAAGDIRAEAVIVSVPPPMAKHIRHEPALPAFRTAVEQGTFMGTVYKAIAVYPEPFWRGESIGELLLLDDVGIGVFDSSPPGGPGHLCMLAGGPEARKLDALGLEARKAKLLSALAAQLGPGVVEVAGWHEKSWHVDPHAGGGYLALPDRDADFALPVSAEPIGRVHWAGTETAQDHPGYFDGAIEAGERAAREVCDLIG